MKIFRFITLFVSFVGSLCAHTWEPLGVGLSLSAAGGSINVTLTATGFNWTATQTPNGSGDNPAYAVYMYSTTGDGGPRSSGTIVFDYNPSAGGTWSGSVTVAAGQWYAFTVREVNSGVVHDRTKYFQTASTEKRVRVAGVNTSPRPIRLVLRSGASDIIGTLDVAPGAAYDQTYSVTSAQEAAGIHLDTFVQDQFTDGVWIQKDTMDTGTATKVGTQSVSGVTLPPGGIPDVGYQAYSNRGPSAAPPSASTSTGGVWTSTNYVRETTDADRLDKATFREGIDKLENLLKGDAADVPAPPEEWENSLITTPENPNKLLDALPAVPAISGPSAPVKTITIALQIPGISVPPVTIDFDNSATSAPIAVFRAIMLAVVSLGYLILSIKTIRGAFAGK